MIYRRPNFEKPSNSDIKFLSHLLLSQGITFHGYNLESFLSHLASVYWLLPVEAAFDDNVALAEMWPGQVNASTYTASNLSRLFEWNDDGVDFTPFRRKWDAVKDVNQLDTRAPDVETFGIYGTGVATPIK